MRLKNGTFIHPTYGRQIEDDDIYIPRRTHQSRRRPRPLTPYEEALMARRVPVRAPYADPFLEQRQSVQRRPIEAPSAIEREQAEELEALRTETAELKETIARLAAERDNERKRLERIYAARAESEREQVLRDMLPLADNLERALSHGPEQDVSMKEGVALTLKAFNGTLARYGVAPIDALGKPFDPAVHEAVGQMPHPTAPHGTVIRVEETGYMLDGKLLRPARVLVAG